MPEKDSKLDYPGVLSQESAAASSINYAAGRCGGPGSGDGEILAMWRINGAIDRQARKAPRIAQGAPFRFCSSAFAVPS